jgi:hypothetical protein
MSIDSGAVYTQFATRTNGSLFLPNLHLGRRAGPCVLLGSRRSQVRRRIIYLLPLGSIRKTRDNVSIVGLTSSTNYIAPNSCTPFFSRFTARFWQRANTARLIFLESQRSSILNMHWRFTSQLDSYLQYHV